MTVGSLARMVASQGPITPRVLVVVGLLLGTSAAAYVTIVVLIGALLSSVR